MKQGLTEIIMIVDKSGSMQAKLTDTIGAFNAFLDKQKKEPGEAKVTLTLFDTTYNLAYNGVPLADVQPFNMNNYVPAGMTALLDAMGKTIDEVGARLDKTSEAERPEKIIVVILTDGEENSSVEYKHEQVMQKVEHQKAAYNWEFVFLGASKVALDHARGLGVTNCVAYQNTGAGTMNAMSYVSDAVASYRATGNTHLPPDAQA
jgi:uncharacterized protein YegL